VRHDSIDFSEFFGASEKALAYYRVAFVVKVALR
jgi:hypothetical protein